MRKRYTRRVPVTPFTVVISADRVVRTVPQRTLHAILHQLADAWTAPGRVDVLLFAYDNLRGL